jgi:cyclic beta-1,2-glucan synthetase
MLFPASEAVVVAVINRLISESVRPSHLPRLPRAGAWHSARTRDGGDSWHVDKRSAADELTHRLELHHLANPERHAPVRTAEGPIR